MTALRDAAVAAFMEVETTEFQLHKTKPFAAHVIRVALQDINEKGYFEFGDAEDYWE